MQKVAWAMITVKRERSMPNTWVKVLLSATPVTITGSAIGRTTRKEMVSRPKKRYRATASEARVPSTIAIAVATSATLIEVQKASGAVDSIALGNQSKVSPGGGHSRILLA